jgi:hypothetical protein
MEDTVCVGLALVGVVLPQRGRARDTEEWKGERREERRRGVREAQANREAPDCSRP